MSHRARCFAALVSCLAFVAVSTLFTARAHAKVMTSAQMSTQGDPAGLTFSIGAGIGMLEGTAYERAYAPEVRAFKLSELKWDLKDVAMAGVQGSVGYGGWFRLNGSYWAAVNEGDGQMVDRDWLLLDSTSDDEWTHESRHPDTTVDEGWTGDVNLDVRVFSAGTLALRGVLGYRQDVWEWSSRGGTFTYTVDRNDDGLISPDEFRTYTGSFPPGQLVISYRQEYRVPYLGLACDGTLGPVQVQAHFSYSPWVSAEDHDFHALRATFFDADFSGGKWFGAGVAGTWFFLPRWYASFGVEYEKYDEVRGDVLITAPEGVFVSRDGGSMALETVLVQLGAGFRF